MTAAKFTRLPEMLMVLTPPAGPHTASGRQVLPEAARFRRSEAESSLLAAATLRFLHLAWVPTVVSHPVCLGARHKMVPTRCPIAPQRIRFACLQRGSTRETNQFCQRSFPVGVLTA